MSCTYVQSQFHVEGVAMVTVLYYTQYLKLLSPPHECIPMLFVFFFSSALPFLQNKLEASVAWKESYGS